MTNLVKYIIKNFGGYWGGPRENQRSLSSPKAQKFVTEKM